MDESIYEPLTDQLRQGDIFEEIPHLWIETETVEPAETKGLPAGNILTCGISSSVRFRPERAIILTQSCEIDKPRVKSLIVCPVSPLASLSSDSQGNVKKNRTFSRLYLPTHANGLPESFVNLEHLTTIDKRLLKNLNRITSLTEFGRRSLYLQFFRWCTRWDLADVFCPNCNAKFNPSEAFSIESS